MLSNHADEWGMPSGENPIAVSNNNKCMWFEIVSKYNEDWFPGMTRPHPSTIKSILMQAQGAMQVMQTLLFTYELRSRVRRNTFPLNFDLLSFRKLFDFLNAYHDQIRSKGKQLNG